MKFEASFDDGDILAGLDKLAGPVAEAVVYSGAAAMARVMYDEVKLNTSGVRVGTPGIVSGTLHAAIYWAKDTGLSTKTLAVYDISWNKRKAPHGHLIEWGTSRSPAYPFVRPALSRMQVAVNAGLARMRTRYAEVAAS